MTRFTGGDGLTGFSKLVHNVMMVNELKGGTGAYQLSHAKAGRSGYSFGGNQMDLLQEGNAHVRELLKDILAHQNVPESTVTEVMDSVSTKGRTIDDANIIKLVDEALASKLRCRKN